MHPEWEGAGHISNPFQGIGQNPHIRRGVGGFNDFSSLNNTFILGKGCVSPLVGEFNFL